VKSTIDKQLKMNDITHNKPVAH